MLEQITVATRLVVVCNPNNPTSTALPAARIADFVHFGAARPRADATLSEPDFITTKAHCLDVFQREVRKG
jgi:hypothetical protein